MKTLSLALRNLLRNRRRSLTTLLAMVIGVASVLVFGGYIRNITYGLQTRYVQSSGHLQIQHKDYFLYGTGNPAAYGIPEYQHVLEVIKQDPELAQMVNVVTPILQVGGIAGNFSAGVSRTVIGTGVVVDDQNRLRSWNDYGLPFEQHPHALTGTSQDSAVIGNGVARVLQLCGPLKVRNCAQPPAQTDTGGASAPDDIVALSAQDKPARANSNEARIEMLAANAHGAPNVASLRVEKAEDQGFKELDDIMLSMHLAQAQRLIYGSESPRVTAIILQLQHTSQMPAAKARVEELLATKLQGQPLQVLEFTTLNPFYGQSIRMFTAIFSFIAILIGAVVLFTVSNTMSMAVVERTTEIGTLRAVGLRRGGIRRLFVCEGLALGLIGALLGVAISFFIASIVNHSGLTWLPPGRVDPVPLTVRVWGETRLIVGAAIGLVIVAVLSAWWPANRASKMNIVDALRHA